MRGQVCTPTERLQERQYSGTRCAFRFSKLTHVCADGSNTAQRPALLPFGDDPAFNPFSSLYSQKAAAREAAFYNTSEGSPELSRTGFPQVFQHNSVTGFPEGFPIFFPVRT